MSPSPSTSFNYVETDIPAGMTIREWQRATAAPAALPRRLRRRVLSHLRHRAAR